ncbi:hypothetical protein IMZ48_40180 [Candidatus Bathyarchaeota archaeon]|nr:hypothetical protein [Candidatus Bathyarchaeota archaeon]
MGEGTFLLGLPLGVGPPVNARLENLLLALKLVLELVGELAHLLLAVVVDVHRIGPVAALERRLVPLVAAAFRHGVCVCVVSRGCPGIFGGRECVGWRGLALATLVPRAS